MKMLDIEGVRARIRHVLGKRAIVYIFHFFALPLFFIVKCFFLLSFRNKTTA